MAFPIPALFKEFNDLHEPWVMLFPYDLTSIHSLLQKKLLYHTLASHYPKDMKKLPLVNETSLGIYLLFDFY